MQIQNVTFDQFVGALAVIIVFIGLYKTVTDALKTYREEKKRREQPVSNLEAVVQEHDEKLKRDHERLNNLEDANRIIMRSHLAMLSHEINGNSDDKLKASFDEIQKYLIEK